MDFLRFFVGIFGNASALFLFLAPVMLFKRIIQNRSTEEFSGVIYILTLLSRLLPAWYGLPFVSPWNVLLSTVNGTGAVIETMYVLTFIVLAPKKEKLKIVGLFAFVLAVFSAVVVISLFAFHGKPRMLFCGFTAAVFSIFMYGSPLSIIRMVIKTKSVEHMPFLVSLLVFLCGTSWFIFGLLGRDPFVAVPNGMGSALGAIQLLLYFIYRDSKSACERPTTQEESVEMAARKPHELDANNAA
ncbi:bidirectional sugar transporter SWEET1-like [Prosopis cineraria]|uniref:bidirectional sugar transporter SWEET1-like n=1 Tax=Prosopis cineraria TaxID=364024 RepID=UPI00240FA8E4|nr:bidirectional sugar transporter SWEET1-like [Prosopis cineraria]